MEGPHISTASDDVRITQPFIRFVIPYSLHNI